MRGMPPPSPPADVAAAAVVVEEEEVAVGEADGFMVIDSSELWYCGGKESSVWRQESEHLLTRGIELAGDTMASSTRLRLGTSTWL
jgi:hypothetical protein